MAALDSGAGVLAGDRPIGRLAWWKNENPLPPTETVAGTAAAETDCLPLMKLFAETLGTIVNGELTQMFAEIVLKSMGVGVICGAGGGGWTDRKSTRLNSSHRT